MRKTLPVMSSESRAVDQATVRMIGNKACGVHSLQSEFYGPGPRTSDNVYELDVLTYDGLRLRVGATPPEELQRITAFGSSGPSSKTPPSWSYATAACVAVLRDELVELFPGGEDARRLARQTYLFAEFLDRPGMDWNWPRLQRPALMHGHCHQKAVVGMDADVRVLKRLGLGFELLDTGCCGMAGSFGFQPEKYELSLQIGERVLLPAVRSATPETLIIADGFSCRQQIEQAGNRRALHLAEAMADALFPPG